MKKKLAKSAARILGAVAAVIFAAWFVVAQPSCRENHASRVATDPAKLREHVNTLSQRLAPRDWQHRDNLDRCADYIAEHFGQAGATVEFQPLTVGGKRYFKDEWGSQSYPTLLLRLMYPSRANFIAVASRWDQGHWIKRVKAGMKGTTDLPVYSIRAPSVIPGIDFSDHLNYWPYGVNALMITDTAFYRNKAYHSSGDTPDRLDYSRLGKVVVAVFETIKVM